MKKYFILICILTVSCRIPEHYFTEAPSCAKEAHSLNTYKTIINTNQDAVLDKLRTKSPKEYRYFFKTFEESAKNTYLIASFAKEEDCFLVKVLVDKWDKLGGMRKTNGVAYPKELYDLTWEIKAIDGKEEVVFIDMHKIID